MILFMKKHQLFTFFILLSVAQLSKAQAGLYFEPFGTSIVKGELTNNDPAVTSSLREAKLEGVQYGARLGLAFRGISIGGEYETGTLDRDWDEATFTDGELETTNVGAFLRSQYGPLALYATYIFDAEHDLDYNKHILKGDGFKLGVGIMLFYNFNLIVEYKAIDYDEYENNPGVIKAYEESEIIAVGLSLPFGL
jgi:hypothetical protein